MASTADHSPTATPPSAQTQPPVAETGPATRTDRILIVEDDAMVARMLADILERVGFRTMHTTRGQRALDIALAEQPALILLDLMLEPEFSGLMVCRRLRETAPIANIPVIILTGASGSQVEAELFGAGADDFIRKGDVRPDVLVHRVCAVLRRVQPPAKDVLEAGDIRMELVGQRATVEGEPVELTPKEFEILARLIRARGEVLSRAELLGREQPVGQGQTSAGVHVAALRRKLGRCGWMVQTVRGKGYRLRERRRNAY